MLGPSSPCVHDGWSQDPKHGVQLGPGPPSSQQPPVVSKLAIKSMLVEQPKQTKRVTNVSQTYSSSSQEATLKPLVLVNIG